MPDRKGGRMKPKFGWVLTNRPYWERAYLLDPPAPYFCRARSCSRPGVWNVKHRDRYVGQSHYWCNDHLPIQYVTALYMLTQATQAAWRSPKTGKAT